MALEAERREYLERYADLIDGDGRRLVVGNGYAREREITTAAGRIAVQAPRVDDRRPGERYISSLLPPYMRRSPKVSEVLPVLYLRGLSTGDFLPALSSFFGSEAGLSASTVGRLTQSWQTEYQRWGRRSLGEDDYVYVWADGVHFNVRLEEDRLCCLVLLGVRPDERKELVAVKDGYREDTQSWLDLLRDLRERGMRDPELAIGDGALGFWSALREVFPHTREQPARMQSTRGATRSSHTRASSAAGCTRARTCWRRCPSACTARRSAHCRRSPAQRRVRMRWMPLAPSPSSSCSGPRRRRRSPTTWSVCWPTMTSPPSTTCTCARQIRSSPPSPRWSCAFLDRSSTKPRVQKHFLHRFLCAGTGQDSAEWDTLPPCREDRETAACGRHGHRHTRINGDITPKRFLGWNGEASFKAKGVHVAEAEEAIGPA